MLLLAFAGRHLLRHWRLNLAILATLTLAAALLAGLPAYADVIAARSLHVTLEQARTFERNLSVTASRAHALTAAVHGLIEDGLGDFLLERVVVREAELRALPSPKGTPDFSFFRLWVFDGMSSRLRLVDGRLPGYTPPSDPMDMLKPPPMEVVIGTDAAAQTGLWVGDHLTATMSLRFDIVGIVEPVDPFSEIWWGDLTPFAIEVRPKDINEDYTTVSFLIAPQSINYAPQHTISWRLLVDWPAITPQNAAQVKEIIGNLQTALKTTRVSLNTALPEILTVFEGEFSAARLALLLLTAQAFIFVLYTLAMMTSFLLDRSQGELANLAGRGASSAQTTLIFALQGLVLALLAGALLGPLLSRGVLYLWTSLSGSSGTTQLQAESWVLSMIAVGFGWMAIVLPVRFSTRRTVLEWQLGLARPARLARWQRLYLDLFLLVFGGLAYWQLSQSGSFVMRRLESTTLADPILLIGPSLLLIAVALTALRVFPWVLRLVAWITRQARGLVFSLGLSRLARSPVSPSRVVLLISLAAGLTLFTTAYDASLAQSQEELALFEAGADLRVALYKAPDAPLAEILGNPPGLVAASPVFRTDIRLHDGRIMQLLAIDPTTFPQVSQYPAGEEYPSMPDVVQALQRAPNEPYTTTLPAIFGSASVPARKGVGDQLAFQVSGGTKLWFEIRGIVPLFPTLPQWFIVTDIYELSRQIDMSAVYFPKANEAWLDVDAPAHTSLVGDPNFSRRILADAGEEQYLLQSDAMAQGTTGAFGLNTLILGVLSVAGFFLVHFFTAQQRTYEFSLLRAMGFSSGQLLLLLLTEGVLVMSLGMLAGTAIGYGLSHVMFPYLSRALANSLSGVTIQRIWIDWPAVLRAYGILAGFFLLAMAGLLLAVVRAGLHRALRFAEE